METAGNTNKRELQRHEVKCHSKRVKSWIITGYRGLQSWRKTEICTITFGHRGRL
jgi:hypothetical protein